MKKYWNAILRAVAKARPGRQTALYGDGTAAEQIVKILTHQSA